MLRFIVFVLCFAVLAFGGGAIKLGMVLLAAAFVLAVVHLVWSAWRLLMDS